MTSHSYEPNSFPETPSDKRYEKHIPALSGENTQRTASTWEWKDSRVHLEHVGDPESAIRMLLVHGAGGNSAAMWPYAAHFSELGAYVTVPDLPGYGKTQTTHPELIRYGDWQKLLVDLVKAEDDDRPLIIMGASMGGLLAYDTAAETGLASQLVVTCLLDPRDAEVRKRLTWHPILAGMAGMALKMSAGPLANVRLPIRWIADMRNIANDRRLIDEVISDKNGGGGKVPLGWMRSFLETSPLVEPERFTDTPVLMLHPGSDRWTPLEISQPFFNRIAAKKQLVILENCGHFPIEEPGFNTMLQEISKSIEELTRKS